MRGTRHAGTKHMGLRLGAAALLTLLLIPLGCATQPKTPPGYFGATLPMDQVIERVNANNHAIPTLFARHYMEANIYDPQKKKYHFINTSGDLFVRKPHDLLLRGKKDVAGLVFELGSEPQRYWMTVYTNEDTMWWGWYRNLGKPCASNIPVRPDLVGEVLGIGDISTDFNQAPVPTMRFNNDLDVYMFVWNAQLPGRWYAQKEIWYDRKDFLPRKVLIFDQNGRILLRANLALHKQVPVADAPKEKWPWIATSYDLFFPETKSTMTMRLSDLALQTKTGQPKPGMIRFPEEPGVNNVIQIDKDCDK